MKSPASPRSSIGEDAVMYENGDTQITVSVTDEVMDRQLIPGDGFILLVARPWQVESCTVFRYIPESVEMPEGILVTNETTAVCHAVGAD